MSLLTEIRTLLQRLDGSSADAIESETVECKSWDLRPEARSSQIRQLREAAVCFANQRGGVIILGVSDGRRTRREAIHGVGQLDAEELRRTSIAAPTAHPGGRPGAVGRGPSAPSCAPRMPQ